ncbi:hypothetical protein M758_3G142000 [Ceratodon purpureus]|nr:hypothetical protein M758_3G142000 [Ceratodon purpureus]
MATKMNGRQPPPVYSEEQPASTAGGPVFRFFFKREASEPLQVLKLRTVESSFAPAYRSWGSKVLLVWRLVVALYFVGVGILYGWIPDWKTSRVLAPVYLTNWGVVAVAVYYIIATINSVHSVCIHSKYEPLSRFWRWLAAIQIFLFELTVVLETLITILYWSFEQVGFCSVDCVTGHALGNACLIVELVFSRLPIRPRHVILTIIYPILWIASQIAWVYTDHPPAYPSTLTMRNVRSIWVCILGLVAFVLAHFLFWLIALARDKLCAGRFYPADEGKEFDHPPLPR